MIIFTSRTKKILAQFLLQRHIFASNNFKSKFISSYKYDPKADNSLQEK